MINGLITSGVLHTQSIIEAFLAIDRKDFVQDEYCKDTYDDHPLPIGSGQTISQPYTVAFMIELLSPKVGQKIMDIGYGSGWQTAILAYIVKDIGRVFAFEIVPQLCDFGKKNISKYNFTKKGIVVTHCQSAIEGLPEEAPFDCIIAAAQVSSIPETWINQLVNGGRMVLPVKNSIFLVRKSENGAIRKDEYPGFAFVPFVDNA